MKKILGMFVIILTAFILFSFNAFSEEVEEKKDSKGGMCPVTLIKGEAFSCFSCHTKKTFEIKEKLPFENWDLPNGLSSMIFEDGAPVGVFSISGAIGAAEGSLMNEFFIYLNSSHKEVKKVIIEIHSPGGSLFEGYKTVGIMKHWRSKGYTVETRVYGFAASAGFFIFCAGEPRLVSPQAELMWHELKTFAMFSISGPSDKEDQAKVLRHLQDTANEMISEMSNLTKEELDLKIRKKEYWINGKQAFEYGFATKLLE